jgi:multiple sugar transport system substrate-binding protein
MPNIKWKALVSAAALSVWTAGVATAGEIRVALDSADPAFKEAWTQLITDFEAAHPEIKVSFNNFEREAYKTAFRNLLTADSPDIVRWYGGTRMEPYSKPGLFEPVEDVWEKEGLMKTMGPAADALTRDGHIYGLPFTYYGVNFYYRKDVLKELGIGVPKNWEELRAAAAKISEAGKMPFATGSKALWPISIWFDYLNMRINGYDFHMATTRGEVPFTDPKIRAVFDKWNELVSANYFTNGHAALEWQDAIPSFVSGDSPMMFMGAQVIGYLRSAGMTDEQVGLFQFPEVVAGVPLAEDGPMNTIHIPSGAKNKEDAKVFMAFVARPDVQGKLNEGLGQLPVNNQSPLPKSPLSAASFEILAKAPQIAQFYDRDTTAEMAVVGMQAFQEFMVHPDRLDDILDRMEAARKRIYKVQ